MNFNYKTAFFITLAVWIVTGFLFLGYFIFTTIAFLGAGKSNLITNECADGDYCANNPINMPKGGWTGMDDDGIAPSVPEDKVSTDNLYQNTDFRFRFDLKEGEQAVACPYPVGKYVSIEIRSNEILIDDPTMACATDGAYNTFTASNDEIVALPEWVQRDYNMESNSYTLAGIKGMRYKGNRSNNEPAPIPDSMDFVVLENEGIFYRIDSAFYDRNVYIY